VTKVFDIVSGADEFKALVLSWFMPASIAVFGFALFVGPSLRNSWLWDQFILATDRLGLNRSLGLALVSALIATLSFTVRDSIFRLLEGYNWPNFLREWRIKRAHRPHARYIRNLSNYLSSKEDLRDRRDSYTQEQIAEFEQQIAQHKELLKASHDDRTSRGRDNSKRLCELLRRPRPLFTPRDKGERTEHVLDLPPYPEEDDHIAATLFGNRMAYVEGYGYATYGLDSQTFWYDLIDVSDDSLVESINDARGKLDTLVALTFYSLVVAAACIPSVAWLIGAGRPPWTAATAGAAFAALAAAWYRVSLGAILDYGWTLRALVNSNRLALATKLGYNIPEKADEERRLWSAMAQRVQHGRFDHESEEFLKLHRAVVPSN
jgi:hypothetical protein